MKHQTSGTVKLFEENFYEETPSKVSVAYIYPFESEEKKEWKRVG